MPTPLFAAVRTECANTVLTLEQGPWLRARVANAEARATQAEEHLTEAFRAIAMHERVLDDIMSTQRALKAMIKRLLLASEHGPSRLQGTSKSDRRIPPEPRLQTPDVNHAVKRRGRGFGHSTQGKKPALDQPALEQSESEEF